MKQLCRYILLFYSVTAFTAGCGSREKEKSEGPVTPKSQYTKTAPGIWEDFAETHHPQVEITGSTVIVSLDFINGPGHYIEKVGIMNAQKKTLTVKEYEAGKVVPVNVKFKLADTVRKQSLQVFAKCNLHDLWVAGINDN